MSLELGFLGESMTVRCRQGATLGPFIATMVNPDETPVDLTNCIVRGDVRRKARDSEIIAAWQVLITDPLLGKYKFWMTDETTAALSCGETITSGDSRYVHDIELEDSSGQVHPLYYGAFLVFREVTRA